MGTGDVKMIQLLSSQISLFKGIRQISKSTMAFRKPAFLTVEEEKEERWSQKVHKWGFPWACWVLDSQQPAQRRAQAWEISVQERTRLGQGCQMEILLSSQTCAALVLEVEARLCYRIMDNWQMREWARIDDWGVCRGRGVWRARITCKLSYTAMHSFMQIFIQQIFIKCCL